MHVYELLIHGRLTCATQQPRRECATCGIMCELAAAGAVLMTAPNDGKLQARARAKRPLSISPPIPRVFAIEFGELLAEPTTTPYKHNLMDVFYA